MKRLLTILLFLCAYTSLFGSVKHNCEEEVGVLRSHFSINFGDTIEAGVSTELSLDITWNVSPQIGVSKASGNGKMTGNLVFSIPGKYTITFFIPTHGDHPASTKTVEVEVSDVKMVFDTKNVKFSQELTTGDNSIEMIVPVLVKTYSGKTIKYNQRDIKTTGVGHLNIHLKEGEAELKDGKNNLYFELSGNILQPGNIQFRVYDLKGEATFFNKSIN